MSCASVENMLDAPRFTPAQFRRSYSQAEVDHVVDVVLADLDRQEPRLSPDWVHEQAFPLVRFKEGYEMSEVDAWLDRAAAELRSRSEGGS